MNEVTLLSKLCDQYMGGISEDVKRLKMWDYYPFFFGFSLHFCCFDENDMGFKQLEASHIISWDS